MDFKNNTELIMYQTEDGQTKIEVVMENETVWLSQDQMVDLFQRDKSTISRHIKNIFDEGELIKEATVAKFATVQTEGLRQVERLIECYNLDVIISVGYRVKSKRGTQFRIWANSILKEYLIKGFALNDEKLKSLGGGTYWKELLDRIREIRTSEKVFYRQVLDLYATSVDYDPKAEESIQFFKIVQNKLHYAVNKKTAPEIIYERANAEKPNMGLSSFKGAFPVKNETTIAKNYLNENELKVLQNLVSAFFDLTELKAQKHQSMTMKDWIAELDDFCGRYGEGVLRSAGHISREAANKKAYQEYEKYRSVLDLQPSQVETEYLNAISRIEHRAKKNQK